MQRSRKYQRFAMRCLQETYATTDHRLKVLLAEMAHEWQRIAEEAKDAKGQLRFRSPEADPGD
jgi:sugar diacid utilization regulator